MKKLLALLLCFILLFSLCACGGDSSAGNDTVDNNTNTNTDTSKDDDSSKEVGFVGSWTHKKTDAEPFTMNITLNADGTGKNGQNTDVKWTLDEATQQISIILIYPDGDESEPSIGKIVDNKLCWERTFKIQTSDGKMLEYDKILFEKQ